MSLGRIHLVFAFLAIASGAIVLLQSKGGVAHRRWGWTFAGSMFGLNSTALFIYNLTGSFGPFHLMAIASLAGVGIGVGHARLHRPRRRWRQLHATWMSWSYVGLLAATASEIVTRVPESPFWWTVVVASGAVMATGGIVISRQLPQTLGRSASTRSATGTEQ